ncbi:TetR/AcrR family transcriptional regulator [Deinococcus yavapaiensis]|uniref:TetR family transcriptional regulator n=1 Tax=Deinococcus yavapaiensis KR-236 TaxID=694435 RepID=A0A318S8W7_9DEIO|nr:TetR family transcriptional regulator [Deinococcus yavapaiensis]PYE54407.1 TetR family transcriptional regulator [Deinococcus yavapaiensis KR-236]
MVIKQRARNDEDKTARREHILDTAVRLWDERPYDELTMSDLAKTVGLAKGTLYLYFRTKEEVFVAVLERLLWTWFATVDERLDAKEHAAPGEVADLLADTLRGQERMVRLLALLNTVLEQNVNVEVGLKFKADLAERLAITGARLARLLPGLDGPRVLLHMNALVIGLFTVTAETPALKAARDHESLRHLAMDFDTELRFSLAALLGGLTQEV